MRQQPQPGPSQRDQSPEGEPTQRAAWTEDIEAQWLALADDLPLAPELTPLAVTKLVKLSREVKRLANLMTAGRDLHDIHTILHLLSQWPTLRSAQAETSLHSGNQGVAGRHRLRPAEPRRIDLTPEFWMGFQPTSRAAQQPSETRRRSATRRGIGQK
jgi:hypothetical protein